MKDAAELLVCSDKVIYAQIKAGKIPVVDLGFDLLRIDPKAWVEMLEKKNVHIVRPSHELQAVA